MTTSVQLQVADRIYASLGPLTQSDAANGYHLRSFTRALATMLVDVESLIRDTAAGPGWSTLMDPDVVPISALGWLAQFVGVDLLGGLTDAQQRQRVKETTGFARGTLASMEGAARQTLTGAQHVIVYERDTSAYHLTIRTYQTETPDPVLTEMVIRSLKPAGLVLVFQVVTGGTYAQLDTAFGTYADMDAALTDYDAQTLWIP